MARLEFIQGDIFKVELPRKFALVYADPPYAGCRFKYARKNNSRQWGRNARADFMRELIARMEEWRADDGVCAVSMASPELRLLHLFPSNHRIFPWVKTYAPHRPHVWPTYAWEPVVAWGKFPGREEQRASKTPHDWLQLPPRVPRKGGHETPKPEEFCRWVLNLALGPRNGDVLELFAGSRTFARVANDGGHDTWAIDTDNYEAHKATNPASQASA